MKVYCSLKTLLQSALWDRNPDTSLLSGLSREEWQAVHDMAVRQSVTALVFDGVQKCSEVCRMAPSLYAQWLSEVKAIEAGNIRILNVMHRQEETWCRHGIDAFVIKGPVCAALYPNPLHRQGGDIDWCFGSGKDWDNAIKVLEDNGIEYRYDSDGDLSYTLGGVVIEHHRKQTDLLSHIFHHFSTSGLGLKQFCDLAMDMANLPDVRGLDKFRNLVCSFLVQDLGLDAGVLPASVTMAPDADVAGMRELVIHDGNFGLDKGRRFSGFWSRSWLCLKYAPGCYFRRWLGLLWGRMTRRGYCNKK